MGAIRQTFFASDSTAIQHLCEAVLTAQPATVRHEAVNDKGVKHTSHSTHSVALERDEQPTLAFKTGGEEEEGSLQEASKIAPR